MTQKEEHKKFVKEFILDYVKANHRSIRSMSLSEINNQTRMYPLNIMNVEEFGQFLKENGYRLIEIKDYLIIKREPKNK